MKVCYKLRFRSQSHLTSSPWSNNVLKNHELASFSSFLVLLLSTGTKDIRSVSWIFMLSLMLKIIHVADNLFSIGFSERLKISYPTINFTRVLICFMKLFLLLLFLVLVLCSFEFSFFTRHFVQHSFTNKLETN